MSQHATTLLYSIQMQCTYFEIISSSNFACSVKKDMIVCDLSHLTDFDTCLYHDLTFKDRGNTRRMRRIWRAIRTARRIANNIWKSRNPRPLQIRVVRTKIKRFLGDEAAARAMRSVDIQKVNKKVAVRGVAEPLGFGKAGRVRSRSRPEWCGWKR